MDYKLDYKKILKNLEKINLKKRVRLSQLKKK